MKQTIIILLISLTIISCDDTCHNSDGTISVCEGQTLCCGDLFCCSTGIQCIKGECVLPDNNTSSPALLIILLTLLFIFLIGGIITALLIIRKKKVEQMRVSNIPAINEIQKIPDASNQYDDFQHQKMQDHSMLEKSDLGNQMQSGVQLSHTNLNVQTTNQNLGEFSIQNKSSKKFILGDNKSVNTDVNNNNQTQYGLSTENNHMVFNITQQNDDIMTNNNDITQTNNNDNEIISVNLQKQNIKNSQHESANNSRLDRTQSKTNSKVQVTDGQSNIFSNSFNSNTQKQNEIIIDSNFDNTNKNEEIFDKITVKDYEDEEQVEEQQDNQDIEFKDSNSNSKASSSFGSDSEENDDNKSNKENDSDY